MIYKFEDNEDEKDFEDKFKEEEESKEKRRLKFFLTFQQIYNL
jgi:hypothetical protein